MVGSNGQFPRPQRGDRAVSNAPSSFQRRLNDPDAPCVIVAEIGVNHDGDPVKARRLVDAAIAAGADAVKFQVFTPEKLVAPGAGTADYQRSRGAGDDQAAMLRRLSLSQDDLTALRDHTLAGGGVFLASAFSPRDVELVAALGVPAIKLGSGELTDPFVLDAARRTGLPLILSTGMAGTDDIDWAVERLAGAPLILLHCTSAYPAPEDELHLAAIPPLRERYGVPVGYSDHSRGCEAAVLAATLGARLIEKHFTLDRGAAGPDHAASSEPAELAELIRRVRRAERLLGGGVKRLRAVEGDVRAAARKGLHAARNLTAGHRLAPGDLCARRPRVGLDPRNIDDLYGRELARELRAAEPLTRDRLVEGTEDLKW